MPNTMLIDLAENFILLSGITERWYAQFDESELDWRPNEQLRTVRESIIHLLNGIKPTCDCVKTGEYLQSQEVAIDEELKSCTIPQLIAYSKKVRKQFIDTIKAATDEDLKKVIHVYYGDFTWQTMIQFAYDEHLHHRGQLAVYLRLLGKAPIFTYDYENNEPLD